MPPKPTYEIDGSRFTTLDGFFDEISRVLIPTAPWGRNLDAFNDILRGGFGTPDQGFTLRWLHAETSRHHLGPELFSTLLDILSTHGPTGVESQDGVDLLLA